MIMANEEAGTKALTMELANIEVVKRHLQTGAPQWNTTINRLTWNKLIGHADLGQNAW